uniref:Uncharacterized protein n=1 Tax=Gasterosteus aculeatus TaxID=69293 RepID=G3PU94_GASAC
SSLDRNTEPWRGPASAVCSRGRTLDSGGWGGGIAASGGLPFPSSTSTALLLSVLCPHPPPP